MRSTASHSCTEAERQARIDLAACHRLAVRLGYHEGIDNHLTLLVPGHDDRFLLAPFGLHWSEIRASHFLVVDFNGQRLSGSGPIEDTAFYIHAPIHAGPRRSRCVLHTHMPYATALSLLEDPTLEMASQNAIGFLDQIAYSCDYCGLALDRAEGERMARALGDRTVLLLRNHGVLVVGPSVAEAFNTLYFFERACEAQVLALSTGRTLRRLPEAIVRTTYAQFQSATLVEGQSRIDLHFGALRRLLDRSEPDYAG
jgi:ribulose-5-phosphate 4-epimerase/fuculose-1-phosphate aldolase